MFKCQACEKTTNPHETMEKKVVETRKVSYRNQAGNFSTGWEIIREISVGPCCFKKQETK